jgi:hypothetical protein
MIIQHITQFFLVEFNNKCTLASNEPDISIRFNAAPTYAVVRHFMEKNLVLGKVFSHMNILNVHVAKMDVHVAKMNVHVAKMNVHVVKRNVHVAKMKFTR